MKPIWQKTFFTVGALLFGWVFFRPLSKKRLQSQAQPVHDYSEAAARIKNMQDQEYQAVREEGRTILFTHQKKTGWVVVLLHGYTNCPQQFRELGRRLFERGCNVFIPRIPHHGLPDRLNKDHARLTAAGLTAFADTVVDLAAGLGDRIEVMGISAGGTLAGWIALSRKDVHHCVLISPVFGYYGIPRSLTGPLMHLLLALPNFFRWWDPERKAASPQPQYVYPQYAMHTLAELLRIGFAVIRLLHAGAATQLPVTFIVNRNDHAVSNTALYYVLRLWQKKSPGYVTVCEFPGELGLDHDIIDPAHERQKIELVYPVILDAMPCTA